MAKKKMPFIRLAIVFLLITAAAVFYSWGYRGNETSGSGMMDESMGEMMGENHLKNITIRDLILQEEQDTSVQSSDDHSKHHDTDTGLLPLLHKITTITIIVLIPFIIAGTIFLMIIWFDKPS